MTTLYPSLVSSRWCSVFRHLPTALRSRAYFCNERPDHFPGVRFASVNNKRCFSTEQYRNTSQNSEDHYVAGCATAESYNLATLANEIRRRGVYECEKLAVTGKNLLHLTPKYAVHGPGGSDYRDIFIFREGCVVMWSVPEPEKLNLLDILQKFEITPFDKQFVREETDGMPYSFSNKPSMLTENRICLQTHAGQDQTIGVLEKFAFSNGLALSVKLAVWEKQLEGVVDVLEKVVQELKKGKVLLNDRQVLEYTGQLLSLRHSINLSSDLLDTPDAFWNDENLEKLFDQTSRHFDLSKRSSVMNERLSYCIEICELLKNHLNHNTSMRVEKLIVILIAIEVLFEMAYRAQEYFRMAK